MKKMILIIVCAAAMGCSGKKVPDVGPQFQMSSSELGLADVNSAIVTLKRLEPDLGPTFQIHSNQPEDVVKSYKEIVCGPLRIVGVTGIAPDPELLTFRLSDSRFPGLKDLPLRTSCVLSVSLENKVGSSVKRDFPIKLNFDSNPVLNITRVNSTHGIALFKMDRTIEMETITINNNFKYAVGFTYLMGRYYCDSFVAYYSPKLDPNYNCSERLKLTPSFVTMSGNYVTVENNPATHQSIMIPPGETVVVKSYAKIPERLPYTKDINALGPMTLQLSGVSHWECADASSRSTALFRDFTLSREDISNPNMVVFPATATTVYPPAAPACVPGQGVKLQ